MWQNSAIQSYNRTYLITDDEKRYYYYAWLESWTIDDAQDTINCASLPRLIPSFLPRTRARTMHDVVTVSQKVSQSISERITVAHEINYMLDYNAIFVNGAIIL